MVEWRRSNTLSYCKSGTEECEASKAFKRSWSTGCENNSAKGEGRRSKRIRSKTELEPSHKRERFRVDRSLKRGVNKRNPKRVCLLDNGREDCTFYNERNTCDTQACSCMDRGWQQQERINSLGNWSSGDSNVDEIIKRSDSNDVFRWIKFEEFENIKPLSSGGNSSLYTANWRSDSAVLKVMHAGTEVMLLFLNELKNLASATKLQKNRDTNIPIPTLHGITKHVESGDYALVMDYYQDGNVRSYIEKNSGSLPWRKRLELLRAVVRSLKEAHEHQIVHCNLHTGNLLFRSLPDNDDFLTVISDFGLSKALMSNTTGQKGSYGVLPYMAPEVITGQPFTMATDTYALGMIMWEISAGEPPFNHCSHDTYLKLSICDGARPHTLKGTPGCWVKLMEKCWQNNPKNRPTLTDMESEMQTWNIDEEFEEAERFRQDHPEPPRKPKHPEAHYSSRFIRSITPPETREVWIDDEDWDQILTNMAED